MLLSNDSDSHTDLNLVHPETYEVELRRCSRTALRQPKVVPYDGHSLIARNNITYKELIRNIREDMKRHEFQQQPQVRGLSGVALLPSCKPNARDYQALIRLYKSQIQRSAKLVISTVYGKLSIKRLDSPAATVQLDRRMPLDTADARCTALFWRWKQTKGAYYWHQLHFSCRRQISVTVLRRGRICHSNLYDNLSFPRENIRIMMKVPHGIPQPRKIS